MIWIARIQGSHDILSRLKPKIVLHWSRLRQNLNKSLRNLLKGIVLHYKKKGVHIFHVWENKIRNNVFEYVWQDKNEILQLRFHFQKSRHKTLFFSPLLLSLVFFAIILLTFTFLSSFVGISLTSCYCYCRDKYYSKRRVYLKISTWTQSSSWWAFKKTEIVT